MRRPPKPGNVGALPTRRASSCIIEHAAQPAKETVWTVNSEVIKDHTKHDRDTAPFHHLCPRTTAARQPLPCRLPAPVAVPCSSWAIFLFSTIAGRARAPSGLISRTWRVQLPSLHPIFGPLAQTARAPACRAEGRGCKTRTDRQFRCQFMVFTFHGLAV